MHVSRSDLREPHDVLNGGQGSKKVEGLVTVDRIKAARHWLYSAGSGTIKV